MTHPVTATQGNRLLRPVLYALLLVGALSRCAGQSMSTVSTPPSKGDLLRRADLKDLHVKTVYEAIVRLRPQFLQARHGGIGALIVIDGMPAGDSEILQTLPIEGVVEVRYLNAIDATTRYGSKGNGGAILVTTGAPRPY